MKQEQRSQNETDDNQGDKESANHSPITGIAIAVWVFVGLGSLFWVVIHHYISDQAKSFEIFIASMLSLAIVIIVVVHAVIYWKQVQTMEQQWEAMRDQLVTMKHQLNAAEIAADAAKESADVARQALQIAERPYLDITKFNVAPIPFEVERPIVYTARIENTGRTPAYDVWGGIYLTISESEILDETGLDYPSFSRPPSKAAITAGRHQTRHRTTPRPLTQFDVERLDDGRLFLYVYGVEFYKDGFTTTLHRFSYCQYYNRFTKRMEVASFHNSSD